MIATTNRNFKNKNKISLLLLPYFKVLNNEEFMVWDDKVNAEKQNYFTIN